MKILFVLFALSLLVCSECVWRSVVHKYPQCQRLMKEHGLTGRFPGAVAHGIHSITLEDLRYYFKHDATEDNRVPTLNYNLSAPNPVLPNAPLFGYDTTFKTIGMRHVDQVLRNMDRKNFYLTNYNVLEQLVHTFHMAEVWSKAKVYYQGFMLKKGLNKEKVCDCVRDVEGNGVMKMLPFMSLKIRYPGITSGKVLHLPDGGTADWSGNLYTYYFFNDWSKELKAFNFNKDTETILSQATDRLVDNDKGINHLDSIMEWNRWKSGMKSMNDHDHYELAMFIFCALNE